MSRHRRAQVLGWLFETAILAAIVGAFFIGLGRVQ